MRACSALQAYMSIPSEPVSARAQVQMVLTALLMLPVIYYLAVLLLPAHFRLEGVRLNEDGIQAEIHGTPFKAGGLESSDSPNHPDMFGSLAQFQSSTIYLFCANPQDIPRLYIKHIPE